MSDRFLEPHARSTGSAVVARLLIGTALFLAGAVALTFTTRFVPWSLWQLMWPLGVLTAGALLIGYGGRNMLVAGLVLVALGGFFLIGVVGALVWWAARILWPFALIFAGVAILTNGFRGLVGRDTG